MKRNIFNTAKFTIGLIAVVLATGGMFGFIDMSWLSPEGIGLAMAAAAGEVIQETVDTKNTSDASSSLLTNTIDKKITLIRPDLNPLDTIIRNIGISKPIKSWQTEYYAVETRGVADTVKTTKAATTSSAEWATQTFVVNNIYIWAVDDVGIFQDAGDGTEVAFNVVAKNNSTDTLTVFILNGIGTNTNELPSLTAADPITRIGNAKSELDAQTSPYAVMPQKSYNYAQIHMAQVEQGVYAKLHDKEVQWNLNDFRSEALYDLRRRMELTSLLGYRRHFYDSTGEDYKYTSGGLVRDITQNLTYPSGTIDNDTFIGWSKDIFTGNNGSSTRVLFAGSDLMKYMGSIPTVDKQLTGENVMVKWGVEFNKIVTNFGTLLVKHHPTLTDLGYNESGVVLDMMNVEKHVLKGLETTKLDLKTAGLKNADADVISEAFCLVLKNPDTHALITKSS